MSDIHDTPPSDQYYPAPCTLCGKEWRCSRNYVGRGDEHNGWVWMADALLCLDCRSELDATLKDFMARRPQQPQGEPDDSTDNEHD